MNQTTNETKPYIYLCSTKMKARRERKVEKNEQRASKAIGDRRVKLKQQQQNCKQKFQF